MGGVSVAKTSLTLELWGLQMGRRNYTGAERPLLEP